jgi:maltose/moltooligosaccharide transporter
VGDTPSGIPLTVKYAFQAARWSSSWRAWTVFTTSEYPPEDMAAFERERRERRGMGPLFTEVVEAVREMPATMRQLAAVQFMTWLGLFCMWLFFVPATARHVFGAHRSAVGALHARGWSGAASRSPSTRSPASWSRWRCPSWPRRRVARRCTRRAGVRRIGLLSVYAIHNQYLLLLSMVGVGIAWASILSMPYAILSTALPPARMGVYMGVFNFFIVIPEIVASLGFGPFTRTVFGVDNPNAPLYVVMIGGGCLLAAAALVTRVHDAGDAEVPVGAVLQADEHEPLSVQGTVQPVPSTGMGG